MDAEITVLALMMEWTAGIKIITVTLTRLDWMDWRVLVLPLLLIQKENINWTFNKGSCQKRFSGFCPLRGGGYSPIPLRKKSAKKNGYFWPKNADFSPF